MILELLLLSAVLFLLPFAAGNPAFLIALAVIIVLCLPVLPLLLQKAPPSVPTPASVVEKMVQLADIHPGNRVYDLGCGDGRFLLGAAKQGADAVGYELSIPALLLAKLRTRKYPSVSVCYGDFWKQDLRDADVIFCYLLIEKMKKFEREVWPHLKAGTRVVSYSFPMPMVKWLKREGDAMVYVK